VHGAADARGHLADGSHDRGAAAAPLIYVDHVTTAPENTFAAAKLQLCLAGPVGTPNGAQLLFAFFDVNGVFSNPGNTADRIWHAVFTPYDAAGHPNPAGTTEGQALIPGRVSLTMKTKSLKHGPRDRPPESWRSTARPSPAGSSSSTSRGSDKRIGKGRTNGKGNYTIRIKIKKKTRVIAQVLFLGDLASCPAPGLPRGAAGAASRRRSRSSQSRSAPPATRSSSRFEHGRLLHGALPCS
jgi:hypothetical protein